MCIYVACIRKYAWDVLGNQVDELPMRSGRTPWRMCSSGYFDEAIIGGVVSPESAEGMVHLPFDSECTSVMDLIDPIAGVV